MSIINTVVKTAVIATTVAVSTVSPISKNSGSTSSSSSSGSTSSTSTSSTSASNTSASNTSTSNSINVANAVTSAVFGNNPVIGSALNAVHSVVTPLSISTGGSKTNNGVVGVSVVANGTYNSNGYTGSIVSVGSSTINNSGNISAINHVGSNGTLRVNTTGGTIGYINSRNSDLVINKTGGKINEILSSSGKNTSQVATDYMGSEWTDYARNAAPSSLIPEDYLKAFEKVWFELEWYTRLKAYGDAFSSLNTIIGSNVNVAINNASNMTGIPKEMIQAILFRELICYGVDDTIADNAVRVGLASDSSTGIGQVTATTARLVHNPNNLNMREMWDHLQYYENNIEYVARILRYEAGQQNIHDLSNTTSEQRINIFAAYNAGSTNYIYADGQRYGVATESYYNLFISFNPIYFGIPVTHLDGVIK